MAFSAAMAWLWAASTFSASATELCGSKHKNVVVHNINKKNEGVTHAQHTNTQHTQNTSSSLIVVVVIVGITVISITPSPHRSLITTTSRQPDHAHMCGQTRQPDNPAY